MFEQVFKGLLSISAIMVGAAALLAAQNGRFQYLSEKEVLVDTRTGDTFMIEDRPNNDGKFIQRLNLRTGDLKEVLAAVDPRLTRQKRDADLSACRTSLVSAANQSEQMTSYARFNDFLAVEDAKRCIPLLSSQGGGESQSDRLLVNGFCQSYLKRDQGESDSDIETVCAKAVRP